MLPWWAWVLIGIGVVIIGVIKISILKKIMQKKAEKTRFTDDD